MSVYSETQHLHRKPKANSSPRLPSRKAPEVRLKCLKCGEQLTAQSEYLVCIECRKVKVRRAKRRTGNPPTKEELLALYEARHAAGLHIRTGEVRR